MKGETTEVCVYFKDEPGSVKDQLAQKILASFGGSDDFDCGYGMGERDIECQIPISNAFDCVKALTEAGFDAFVSAAS